MALGLARGSWGPGIPVQHKEVWACGKRALGSELCPWCLSPSCVVPVPGVAGVLQLGADWELVSPGRRRGARRGREEGKELNPKWSLCGLCRVTAQPVASPCLGPGASFWGSIPLTPFPPG